MKDRLHDLRKQCFQNHNKYYFGLNNYSYREIYGYTVVCLIRHEMLNWSVSSVSESMQVILFKQKCFVLTVKCKCLESNAYRFGLITQTKDFIQVQMFLYRKLYANTTENVTSSNAKCIGTLTWCMLYRHILKHCNENADNKPVVLL